MNKLTKYCNWCREDIDAPANVEKVLHYLEKFSGMEIGKKIYLSILDEKFKAIDLCNLCYTMMQNYRQIEGKDLYEKDI